MHKEPEESIKDIIPASCDFNAELKAAILKQHDFNQRDLKFQGDL